MAPLGVPDLGMELHAVDRAVAIGERRRGRRVGGGEHRESGRRADDGVEVAHPHDLLERLVVERPDGDAHAQRVRPYSPRPGLRDLTAELQRDELRAVTDAEDRHAGVVDRRGRSSARPRRAPTPGRPRG